MLKLSLLILTDQNNSYSVEALWSDTDNTLPIKRTMNSKGQYYFYNKDDLFESILDVFSKCNVDTLNLFFQPDNQNFCTDIKILTGQIKSNKRFAASRITDNKDTQDEILRFFNSTKLNITVY